MLFPGKAPDSTGLRLGYSQAAAPCRRWFPFAMLSPVKSPGLSPLLLEGGEGVGELLHPQKSTKDLRKTLKGQCFHHLMFLIGIAS